MSWWEYLPYVGAGKALAKKPPLVQVLLCWVLAIPWIVLGIVSTQRWALALGVLWLIVPLVSLARQRRTAK